MPSTGLVIALVVVAALVSGCAAPEASLPDDGVDPALRAARRDAALETFDHFRVRGGLGIWNEERSLSVRLDWTQRGDDLALALEAPLGLGSATLRREGGRATLRRGDAPPLVGTSADVVLQRALGLRVPVPLEQLALWLRGLPGAAGDLERDAAGRLRSLRWTDAVGTRWQARVLDYARLDRALDGSPLAAGLDALELPVLLTARGAGHRLRLVLRDWVEIDEGAMAGTGVGNAAEEAPSVTKPSPQRPVAPARLPIPTR